MGRAQGLMQGTQLSSLEAEVKVVKGEIEAILKELRTALLRQDNPFSPHASLPAFRAVPRQLTEGSGAADLAESALEAPVAATSHEDQGTGKESRRESAAVLPLAAYGNEAVPRRPASAIGAALDKPPTFAPETALTQLPDVAANQSADWSLLAIASLVAWAEDAIESLGRRRYRLVLELASFAKIVPQDVHAVLMGVADSDAAADEADKPLLVNDYLIVLTQLDAIVRGDRVTRPPRRRPNRRRLR